MGRERYRITMQDVRLQVQAMKCCGAGRGVPRALYGGMFTNLAGAGGLQLE